MNPAAPGCASERRPFGPVVGIQGRLPAATTRGNTGWRDLDSWCKGRIIVPDKSEAGDCKRALRGGWTGTCQACLNEKSLPSEEDLNIWHAGDDIAFWMPEYDEEVHELILTAWRLVTINFDLAEWSLCVMDDGWHNPKCLENRFKKGKPNKTLIEVKPYSGDGVFPYNSGSGLTYWLDCVFTGNSSKTYCPESQHQAYATNHGYISISSVEGATFRNALDIWRGQAEDWGGVSVFQTGMTTDRLCAALDVSVALWHEMQHVCNQAGDKGECSRVDLVETAFQFAMSERYNVAAQSACCRSSDVPGFKWFARDGGINWHMFGSGAGFGVGSNCLSGRQWTTVLPPRIYLGSKQ